MLGDGEPVGSDAGNAEKVPAMWGGLVDSGNTIKLVPCAWGNATIGGRVASGEAVGSLAWFFMHTEWSLTARRSRQAEAIFRVAWTGAVRIVRSGWTTNVYAS